MRLVMTLLVACLAACASGGASTSFDAAPRVDADPLAPDADPFAPDADPAAPDATPAPVDASGGVPDAQACQTHAECGRPELCCLKSVTGGPTDLGTCVEGVIQPTSNDCLPVV
jgi:hypothetical protein